MTVDVTGAGILEPETQAAVNADVERLRVRARCRDATLTRCETAVRVASTAAASMTEWPDSTTKAEMRSVR